MSEPKRAMQESSINVPFLSTSDTPKAPLDSAADLFPGHWDRASLSVQEEPKNRKRKEMEENIEMDELESIMSVDMDFFDELPAAKSPQAQTLTQSSHEKKANIDAVETASASKRQRLHFEEDGKDRRQQHDVKENNREKPEQRIVSIKTEEPHPVAHSPTYEESSKRPEMSASTQRTNIKAFEDVEVKY